MMQSADGDETSTSDTQTIPLPELFDFFQPPSQVRIVSGLDVLSRVGFDLTPDAVFTVSSHTDSARNKITLSWQVNKDSTQRRVLLPVDSPIEFSIQPYDPISGECHQLVYHTVAELARCFPPFVRINSLQNLQELPVKPGDLLKLIRLVIENKNKFIQCRSVYSTTLFNLPFDCIGKFTAEFDNNVTYTLADLVCGHVMPVRRRRVLPASRDDLSRIRDLPPGVSLYIEKPQSLEARQVDDPTTLIRLPSNDGRIIVSRLPDNDRKSQSLASLVEQFPEAFPLVVVVDDWKEETTITENHFIRPGVELVLHGTIRPNKVLAMASGHFFSIPMIYRGLFQRRPRMFAGARQLHQAAASETSSELIVRVVYISRDEQLSIELGEKLRIEASSLTSTDSMKAYIACERLDSASSRSSKGKEQFTKVLLSSTASFEEVLDFDRDSPQTIAELAELITSTACELRVQLVEQSHDMPRSIHHDLPLDSDITLCNVFSEPSVYVSVDSPEEPVFHIPLRTKLFVSLLSRLDKQLSPILNPIRRGSKPPKMSTLDRCPELLSPETVSLLRQTVLSQSNSTSRVTTTRLTSRQDSRTSQTSSNGKLVTIAEDQEQSIVATDSSKNSKRPKSVVISSSKSTIIGDDDVDDSTLPPVTVSAKAGNFKLRIPDDGNLYHLSAKRFQDLLECLRLDPQVIESCRRRRIDGKKFSRLSDVEMEMSGLMNPVLLHFRRSTVKH